jgi:hypothetical protein
METIYGVSMEPSYIYVEGLEICAVSSNFKQFSERE